MRGRPIPGFLSAAQVAFGAPSNADVATAPVGAGPKHCHDAKAVAPVPVVGKSWGNRKMGLWGDPMMGCIKGLWMGVLKQTSAPESTCFYRVRL